MMSVALDTGTTQRKRRFDPVSIFGDVASVSALGVQISDRLGALKIGGRVNIRSRAGERLAEIVEVRDRHALALPFGTLTGVARGDRVQFLDDEPCIAPSAAWLGRVIDGLGRPIDGKGPLPEGPRAALLRARPPAAPTRARLGAPIDFGVKALNCFSPAQAGQRLGVFAAAGVGKSVLLGMVARHTQCDISVIALIGERGREVRDFLDDHLGADGLARSIVIVATSDEPAMMRRQAGFLALCLSEYFRDEGAHVMCLMDSLTRVAQAQREIGLAAGEPPTMKGYTPSVFSLLPGLIERAGPGPEGPTEGPTETARGCVSAVFSVLVEGDDHDEPIADAARACLDGHVVLDRRIAERGRLPAMDILRSVSRASRRVVTDQRREMIREIKALASAYDDMRELVRIGAYRAGADAALDRAIAIHDELEDFLRQEVAERVDIDAGFEGLRAMLDKEHTP